MNLYLKELKDNGVCVIPISKSKKRIKELHDKYICTINSLPEFKEKECLKVLGGFGAIGTASSFHHPYIRNLRRYLYNLFFLYHSQPLF